MQPGDRELFDEMNRKKSRRSRVCAYVQSSRRENPGKGWINVPALEQISFGGGLKGKSPKNQMRGMYDTDHPRLSNILVLWMQMRAFIRNLFARRGRPWNPYLAQCLTCAEDMVGRREYAAAVHMLKDCIRKSPDHPDTYFVLASALQGMDDKAGACDAYRAYLKRDPDDARGARINLFLLTGDGHPDTLSASYVTGLFDAFAPTFDKNLNDIEYRAPTLLAAEMLAAHPHRFTRLLDLGCGTGLSGLPYRDHADRIEGVDMSEKMLEKAREKNIYAHLHRDDLHDFLARHPNTFDAIVSADVLVYVGALERAVRYAAAALTPGGIFGFTVQRLDEDVDFRMGDDHRYWYGQAYLERCMRDAHLSGITSKHVTLRLQYGEPVPGIVMLGRRGN